MTTADGLALLREPFKPSQINQLPKPYNKDSPKGQCRECGGYHGLPALHLDFVGHAALTDRFLDADPAWTWEPLALDEHGLPAYDRNGGMWIRLTICGVTRLGYGDAQGKTGPNAIKEIIGDALRNAGMRFGAALDLWHKGDLHDAAEESGKADPIGKPAEPFADEDTTNSIDIAIDALNEARKQQLRDVWQLNRLPKPSDLTVAQSKTARDLIRQVNAGDYDPAKETP
jgi:hypothetical protein